MENSFLEERRKAIITMVTKKRAILFTVLWLTGAFLLLAAQTDLFTHGMNAKFSILNLMVLLNAFFVFNMWMIYFKKKD